MRRAISGDDATTMEGRAKALPGARHGLNLQGAGLRRRLQASAHGQQGHIALPVAAAQLGQASSRTKGRAPLGKPFTLRSGARHHWANRCWWRSLRMKSASDARGRHRRLLDGRCGFTAVETGGPGQTERQQGPGQDEMQIPACRFIRSRSTGLVQMRLPMMEYHHQPLWAPAASARGSSSAHSVPPGHRAPHGLPAALGLVEPPDRGTRVGW